MRHGHLLRLLVLGLSWVPGCAGDGGDTIVSGQGFDTCDGATFDCVEPDGNDTGYDLELGASADCADSDSAGTFECREARTMADEAAVAVRVGSDTRQEMDVALVTELVQDSSGDFRCNVMLVAEHEQGSFRTLPTDIEVDLANRIVRTAFKLTTGIDVVLLRTDQGLVVRRDEAGVLACFQNSRSGIVIANLPKPAATLNAVGRVTPGTGYTFVNVPGLPWPLINEAVLGPRCVELRKGPAASDEVLQIALDNYTAAKSNPLGGNPCILTGGRYIITIRDPSTAGDDPNGGGDLPAGEFIISVPVDNPDLGQYTISFPETDAPGNSLASVAANPAVLVGAKVLHTFEPPPGVPAPPPPGPQPELVQAILALDPVTGDELARLPLGDNGDAGLSCQLLSYNGASGRIDQFFIYGQVNFAQNFWNPDIADFGATLVSVHVKNVTDFSRYSNDQFAGGGVAAWFGGSQLLFFEYDPAPQSFIQKGSIEASQFAGASGGPVSGFRWQAGGQTVFVTDGQPGEVWSHPGTGTLAQASTAATKIGNLGNGPRQIRFLGEIGVVSNFDSGTLTIVRRQSDGTVTILGTVTVGSGPIALDLRLNSAGNIEVLSAGFNDHTYTLTVLSPTGGVIGTPTTRTVPEGGLNPVHAIFVNAGGTRISITCNGSDEVLIFDLPS